MRESLRSLLLSALLWAGISSAQSVEILPLPELKRKFEKSLAENLAPIDEERETLIDGYKRVIQKSLEAFQSEADLDKVLLAKKELGRVEETGSVGSDEFPEIAEYRETFRDHLSRIDAKSRAKEIEVRRSYVAALNRYGSAKTRTGEIDSALEYSGEARKQGERIAELENFVEIAEEPELDSVKIVDGNATHTLLKKYDESISVVRKASSIEVSSSHPQRDLPSSLLNKDRGDDMDDFDKMDVWCLERAPGWLRVVWENPAAGREILLVNRPHPHDQDDLWAKSQITVNGTPVAKLENFGRGKVALIRLKRPVLFKNLYIEISEGTWSPGLHALEVYPPDVGQSE